MSPYQQRERRLIALGGEPPEELMITERTDPVDFNQLMDVPKQIRRRAAHGFPLARMESWLLYTMRGAPRFAVFNYLGNPSRARSAAE
jgi:hypothetical protein